MVSTPNPVRRALLLVGELLVRAGLVERERIERATDLSWPRIVTGIARTSKSAADIAMVGIAVGPAAIAGVGFAALYWELVFSVATGVAGGMLGLVSQRYGADEREALGLTVEGGAMVALLITAPLAVAFWVIPGTLIGLVGSGGAPVGYGTEYLRVLALGVPFAALNLVGSRTLVGVDDAWTPMVLRGGGAAVNVLVNAVLIFGLGMGVTGAAIGTVVGNGVAAVAFSVGAVRGRLPWIGTFPVQLTLARPHLDVGLVRQLVTVSAPLILAGAAHRFAGFVKLALVATLGPTIVAAFVVAMRVRGLMGTPGWGFSLASSSLVGQALGTGDEGSATEWAQDVLRFSVAVYAAIAAVVFLFARPVGRIFVSDPALVPLVATFIRVACVSIVFGGVSSSAMGPLRASGDTRWLLYAQLAGMYLVALPLVYAGSATALGVLGVYLAIVGEKAAPAALNYFRFRRGTWKAISREYRPEAAADD
ncbi:MAG: MATE family efflux transporter [Haloarculaceae archaeon]